MTMLAITYIWAGLTGSMVVDVIAKDGGMTVGQRRFLMGASVVFWPLLIPSAIVRGAWNAWSEFKAKRGAS
jgi:hypothetical protein